MAAAVAVGLLAAELTLVWPDTIRSSFDQADGPPQWNAEAAPQVTPLSSVDITGPADDVQPIPTVPPPPTPPSTPPPTPASASSLVRPSS